MAIGESTVSTLVVRASYQLLMQGSLDQLLQSLFFTGKEKWSVNFKEEDKVFLTGRVDEVRQPNLYKSGAILLSLSLYSLALHFNFLITYLYALRLYLITYFSIQHFTNKFQVDIDL